MSYESTVYRILIASPSDVDEEREVVARIIQDWNDLNSFNKKIVLLPVRWETHSSPTFGIRPQEAINTQLVDDCDLLIGFFWTKIGTPTGEEIGGTVEEIKRVSKAGKPVMLYFSKRGKDPSQLDLQQLTKLNAFKEDVYSSALVENFNSIVDFRDKLSRQLEMKIRELQEQKGSNKKLLKYSFVDISNGKLTGDKQEISIERIEVNKKDVDTIIKNDERVFEKKWRFQNSLSSYINKRNNIPIAFGLKNNDNRALSNINIELKISSSKKDSLSIESMGSVKDRRTDHRFNNLLSSETGTKIRKLLNEDQVQISSNKWELMITPFSLLPDRESVLKPVLLLFPRDSMTVNFDIRLFSENILQVIESSCELKINFKSRPISQNELDDIIDNLPEDDDLPF